MSNTNSIIVVCSKLAHGLSLNIGDKSYVINGQNSNKIIKHEGFIGECGYTQIEAKVWEQLAKKYASLIPVKKGFIFTAKDMFSAEDASKEKKDMKTGQEQINLSDNAVYKM